MKRCRLIGLGLVMVFISGCGVGLKENLRGAAGISTKVLEDNLSSAAYKDFNLDYDAAFSLVKEIIKKIGSYIYAVDKSKNLIAIYASEDDTTPVGIFFKALDNTKTRILISSPSNITKAVIVGEIFPVLENKGYEN